jgi:hypothetical protein
MADPPRKPEIGDTVLIEDEEGNELETEVETIVSDDPRPDGTWIITDGEDEYVVRWDGEAWVQVP